VRRKNRIRIELAALAISLVSLAMGLWLAFAQVYQPLKPYQPTEEYVIPGLEPEAKPGGFEIHLELPPDEPETFEPETVNTMLSENEAEAVEQQEVFGEPQVEIEPSEDGDGYYTVVMRVSPSGAGTVYPSEGEHRVKEGALTIQVMSVKPGYEFEKWVIEYDSTRIDGGSAMFKTIQVVRDLTITAVFEKKTASEGSSLSFGSLVVDFAFYDKIAVAPQGTVRCVETGETKSLRPVEVSPNEWHGQAKFTSLEIGETYHFEYLLSNGCKASGSFSKTIKRSVEYYHHGFPYEASASLVGWVMSQFNLAPREVKEVGGIIALASAPIVVVSALAYVRGRR